MAEPIAVEIRAELRQIKTMADFTANLILNIPEDCREQVKTMMDWLGDEVSVILVSENHLDSEIIADGRARRKRAPKKG